MINVCLLTRRARALALLAILLVVAGCNGNGTADTSAKEQAPARATTAPRFSSTSTAPTVVVLSSSTYSVPAFSTAAVITVLRVGDATGEATVGYTTVDGTASAGTDYTPTSGSLSWSDGDTSAQTITVAVRTQAAGKNFNVALTSVTGAADFGSPSSATVAVASVSSSSSSSSSSSGSTSGSSSGATPSASGTMIPSANQIVDSALNVWTVASGVVYERGKTAGSSANVVLLLYYASTVYQENKTCLWWSWNGSAWVATSNPAPKITPNCAASTASTTSSSLGFGTPTAPRFAVDMVMEEAQAPFTSWGNVQTVYGAVGNGIADDTSAIQSCLTAMAAQTIQVCYFPAGTYKITSQLTLNGTSGGVTAGESLIGADPATTKIQWAGGSGGTMLLQNGGQGTKFERLSWDGAGTAQYGVAEWFNTTSGLADASAAEHQDEVFQNMAIGIQPGREGANYSDNDSEGTVRRVQFINDTYAGIDTGSGNAVDWWVWDSTFINCARGFANTYAIGDSGQVFGAGAGNVYRSYFNGSTVADFNINNTEWFSLHNNVSLGGAQFILAGNEGQNAGPLIAEGNRVVSSAATPVLWGNAGPVMLVDNQLQATGTMYSLSGAATDSDGFSLGNSAGAAVPTATGTERIVSVNDSVVANSSISSAVPTMPNAPAVVTHTVYEIASGASAATIQTTLNTACTPGSDPQPIVHFGGVNTWSIGTTLSIAANSTCQLVGDGFLSWLEWTGGDTGGPIITIAMPSRVTVRDLQLGGGTGALYANSINITGADSGQSGGRIQFVEDFLPAITASGLLHTALSFQAESGGVVSLTLTNVLNAVSISNGGFGQVIQNGTSSFIMEDQWEETATLSTPTFQINNGRFTYLGGVEAPGVQDCSPGQTVPVMEANATTSWASWIGMSLNTSCLTGYAALVENETPQTWAYFLGNVANSASWNSRPGSGGDVGFNLNRQSGPSTVQYASSGDTSNTALLNTWAQARSLTWDSAPYVPPAGQTDIKIYHVFAAGSLGISIAGT
jgi:hypothetical protein